MDGGRSAGRSPQGPGPHGAPGRSWTQGQESDRGPGGRQGPSPPFHCALCQLQVNSETQLKQVGQVRLGLRVEQR